MSTRVSYSTIPLIATSLAVGEYELIVAYVNSTVIISIMFSVWMEKLCSHKPLVV